MLNYNSGVVLAIDYGLTKIGIAQGDFNLKIALPIKTIITKKQNIQLQKIQELIIQWQPDMLVVGLPLHMDGTSHNVSKITSRFAYKLKKMSSLDIYLVDERLTSITSKSILNDIRIYGKNQKNYIDQISAVEILKTFFENGYIKKI